MLLLGCACLALLAYQVWGDNGYRALLRRRQEERQWEERIELLRRHNAELQKRIHDLQTDPRAIEKAAREDLGMARPDEKVIRAPRRQRAEEKHDRK